MPEDDDVETGRIEFGGDVGKARYVIALDAWVIWLTLGSLATAVATYCLWQFLAAVKRDA